jgi:hypothetical protein
MKSVRLIDCEAEPTDVVGWLVEFNIGLDELMDEKSRGLLHFLQDQAIVFAADLDATYPCMRVRG